MSVSCDASTPYYETYTSIINQLRCPVCGGQRISSSDSQFAISVKRDVCGFVRQGMDTDAVITRVEKEYGQSLRMTSTLTGDAWPLFVLCAVLFVVAAGIVRRLTRTGNSKSS